MRIIVFIFFFLIFPAGWAQQNFSLKPIEKEITEWEFRMVGDSVWKPAKVPGTIIDNFVALDNISNPLHPYYGDNEKIYQWISEKDWEFRTALYIDSTLLKQGYTYNIEFGCLDLFADVYINERIWNHANAFCPLTAYEFQEAKLEIKIIFHSTVNTVKKLMENDSLKLPGGERVYARTAQYQFGWDWGPKFVNMGIRKPVKLILNTIDQTTLFASIHGLDIKKNKAYFWLNLDINSRHEQFQANYIISINNAVDQKFSSPIYLKQGETLDSRFWVIDSLQLWWPNRSGRSNFYSFEIQLTLPGDTQVIAQTKFDYAFCNIVLKQEKDTYGESFYFLVNGKKVYVKGANYVPDDSFEPGKNTESLIQMAKEANMNILRVWGGGTYPDNDFYEACIKNGIMVWQDYMYACAMYPLNDEFNYNITEEAYYQSDRLSQFNNIAVWCGNNEIEEGWKNWGWQKELKISPKDSSAMWNNYVELFQNILQSSSHQYDTLLSYISTSPKHGWGRKESMKDGDSHYWGVWWGLEPIEKYNEKIPRFMSEFGMQSMPDLSTLKKVIPDSALNVDSPKFKNHQKHPTGFETLDHYLKAYLVIPNDMGDYAYATQVLQAYALSTAIEAQRRAMPYCMGSLLWQLNDCWPVTSWSIIDYELKPKPAYFEIEKAFASKLISVIEEKGNYNIYIINDGNKPLFETLSLYIADFYGKKIWEKKIKVKIPPFSSKIYFTLPHNILKNMDPSTVYFHAYIEDKIKNTETFFHFVKLNELKLPAPQFHLTNDDIHSCDFSSSTYCPYTLIPGYQGSPDNYVGTMYPGKTISFYIDHSDLDNYHYILNNIHIIKCLNTLLKK